MAEKDPKQKATASKPASTSAKSTSTATKPAASAKPTTAAKPATATAAKSASTTKSTNTAAKPASTATAKSATTAAKPASSTTKSTSTTAKPAASTKQTTAAAKPATTNAKPTSTAAKPATATAKPAASAKPTTTAKQSKKNLEKSTDTNGGKGFAGLVAMIRDNKKVRIIVIAVLAFVCALTLILGITLGVKGCNTPNDPFDNFNDLTVTTVASSHKNKTQVGYSGEILGTVERYKPVSGMQNEGFNNGSYPKFGSTLNLTTQQKTDLIILNRKLTANGTWVDVSKRTTGSYDKMDKDGYLYKLDGTKPGNGVPEQLYKHTASVGMYGGNVSDSEKAVIKKLTIRPRSYGSYYSVTGLYAPAGEVIKIQLSDADMKATGGLTIHIGQA
ncbi:MAG: hypothetical protein K2N47_04035, partial [Clostridia bacterium]|nr:hypothetical protein [Clostridia bacterium]